MNIHLSIFNEPGWNFNTVTSSEPFIVLHDLHYEEGLYCIVMNAIAFFSPLFSIKPDLLPISYAGGQKKKWKQMTKLYLPMDSLKRSFMDVSTLM